MSQNKQSIAIVGAGLLGMTLALRLSQKGYRVTIYEAAKDVGGLAASWQIGDFTWDKFYHVILISDQHTRGLLKELGLEQDMRWVETKTGFYTDGQLYSMSDSLEFLKFPPLNLIDKLRLGLTIAYAAKIKHWQTLEKIKVEDWLVKWSGKTTFEKIWRPLLQAKLGESYHDTSAAFIWTTIQRMYAARRSGMKNEMFGYLPGGYNRILDTLSQKINDFNIPVHANQPLQKLDIDRQYQFAVKSDSNATAKFDKIILTIPSVSIPKVYPLFSAKEKHILNDVQYLGVICASMVLNKGLSPYYVTNITESGVPFTGIIEMSALVDPQEFNGKQLIYLPKYVLPDNPMFDDSDENIRKMFIPALQKIHPELTDNNIIDFKIARAKYVFSLPTIKYSQKVPHMKTSVPGLYIVNSSQIVNGTLNVNETIQLAERAIEKHF